MKAETIGAHRILLYSFVILCIMEAAYCDVKDRIKEKMKVRK